MNVDRIQQLADHIEGLPPGEYDQDEWTHLGCGTPACIAGHAAYLFNRKGFESAISLYGGDRMSDVACHALEIDGEVGTLLFASAPLGWRDSGSVWETRPVPPDVAVSCLRTLADTGKVDWHGAWQKTEEGQT